MLERNVKVKYLPIKDSFIYVSKSLNQLTTGSCVKLTLENGNTSYFSVSNSVSSLDQNSIGISSLYCKAIGIAKNEDVFLTEIPTLPTINSISITPSSESDYDIIESLAENVQSTLMNQIRVVYSGQKFVIWIGNNINATVTVDIVKPVSPGILGFLTEVHIKPSLEYVEKPNVLNNKIVNIGKRFQTFYDNINVFKNKPTENKSVVDTFLNYKQDLVYRLVGYKNTPSFKEIGRHLKTFNVFISKENLAPQYFPRSSVEYPVFCSLSVITDEDHSKNIIYSRIFFLEDFSLENRSNFENNIFVNETILDYLDCDLGARVLVNFISKVPFVKEIMVQTKKNYLVNIEEEFKKYLSEISDDITVLNPNIPIQIGSSICELKLSPIESKFVIVDDKFVRNCKCYVADEEVHIPLNDKTKDSRVNIGGYLEDICNYLDIVESISLNFTSNSDKFENVLIVGKPGTGKSTILNVVTEKVKSYPSFIYTKIINCRSFRGKTPDSLIRNLAETFSTLILHQPSVLMLDNLHILCQNIQGDETAPNGIYYNRISEMLHNFFKLVSGTNQIGICATTESIEKLNKNLYTSRGSHLFKNVFTIHELNKLDRSKLLKHLFSNETIGKINFEELAVKTEGYVVHDIIDFFNKTIFEVHKWANDDDSFKINQHHCTEALKNTCVLSLQNVNLHSPGDKDFKDVGGLDDVKETLVENLLWPAKYPNIFANAPLRLQTGLLLFGPPGTGKTLLAAAAAKHCGLRLISVKGPELLSKYIGASEQAVRDIFEKAQSVRPCILFFDEFDSLAPRRGHDNTGVTDRVVNQILTQLDGIESLKGVCVLAATSRPDLLDPALLRPGRLDKQLLCPLPDKNGRSAILSALSKNLDLGDDVDLSGIAEVTEFYSGADLQALLYTAQIATIEGLVENEKIPDKISISTISQRHMEDALAKTKPSLTKQERTKYERIYAKFQLGSNLDNFKAGTRATLA